VLDPYYFFTPVPNGRTRAGRGLLGVSCSPSFTPLRRVIVANTGEGREGTHSWLGGSRGNCSAMCPEDESNGRDSARGA